MQDRDRVLATDEEGNCQPRPGRVRERVGLAAGSDLRVRQLGLEDQRRLAFSKSAGQVHAAVPHGQDVEAFSDRVGNEAEALMTDFYTRIWKNGEEPRSALRAAKRAARERGVPFRDWAGWMITGR
jgi:hypothetical protein